MINEVLTNLFTGSEALAEQRTVGSDHVVWHHRDPVTGETINKVYDALGQVVGTTLIEDPDPEPFPPPDSHNPAFAEWQCDAAAMMGQTFYEMPNDCRKAFHQESWQVRFTKKEGDPTAIPKKDRHEPVHKFDQESSVSDMLYAKTLRSTDKKMTAEGENEDDDLDCDITNCTVEASDIPDFIDASSDGEYRIVSRPGTKFISGAVQFFLDKNPECEALYNKLLNQLSKDTDVELEGDIRHFVREFGKTGTLSARTFTPEAGIAATYGRMNPTGPDFGEAGWGFQLDVSTNWGSKTFESFANGFLGELVHAIGERDGKSHFGDEEGAKALSNLGIGLSLEEWMALPERQAYLKKDSNGKVRSFWEASALWHGIMSDSCSKLPGAGRFIGLR